VELILVIDIGTSSVRTAFCDGKGNRLVKSTAQQHYKLKYTSDGGAELSPEILQKASQTALKKTLTFRRRDRRLRKTRIMAIGSCGLWHSLIGIDRCGDCCTPIYTWADSRAREDAGRLRAMLPERKVHRRTGCMLHSSFWPAKLLWLRRTEPSVFRGVDQWMSPAEWLHQRLFGVSRLSISMASGTGLFNQNSLDWDKELLETCGIARDTLAQPDDEPQMVSETEWPELEGVSVFPAIGDGAASNLGCGATETGWGAINVGTSGALRIIKSGKNVAAPFGLFRYRVDAKRLLIGGAISNAGNLHEWCVRELRLRKNARQLERRLRERKSPAHGLVILPFWSAERAPLWDEKMPGAIYGITHKTSALDIAQAVSEAAFHQLARIADLLTKSEGRKIRWIVSGGIQNSASMLQRLANVLNVPLHASAEEQASLRGAAIFVLEKLGRTPAEAKFTKAIEPQPKIAQRYAEERRRQFEFEKRLRSAELFISQSLRLTRPHCRDR
jgi:gluconokinase